MFFCVKKHYFQADEEFEVGERVKVSEQFMSNSNEVIKAKSKGNIISITKYQQQIKDMQINFDKLNSPQWVTSTNFHKLYTIHVVF